MGVVTGDLEVNAQMDLLIQVSKFECNLTLLLLVVTLLFFKKKIIFSSIIYLNKAKN